MDYCIMCRYYGNGFCYNFNIFADPASSCEYQEPIDMYDKREVTKNV